MFIRDDVCQVSSAQGLYFFCNRPSRAKVSRFFKILYCIAGNFRTEIFSDSAEFRPFVRILFSYSAAC